MNREIRLATAVANLLAGCGIECCVADVMGNKNRDLLLKGEIAEGLSG